MHYAFGTFKIDLAQIKRLIYYRNDEGNFYPQLLPKESGHDKLIFSIESFNKDQNMQI